MLVHRMARCVAWLVGGALLSAGAAVAVERTVGPTGLNGAKIFSRTGRAATRKSQGDGLGRCSTSSRASPAASRGAWAAAGPTSGTCNC